MVPDAEADLVEVPETNCPLDDAQINRLRIPIDVTINNVVDAYFDILHQTMTILYE